MIEILSTRRDCSHNTVKITGVVNGRRFKAWVTQELFDDKPAFQSYLESKI